MDASRQVDRNVHNHLEPFSLDGLGPTIGCHDVGVFLPLHLAAVACLSDNFTRVGGWVLLADGVAAWYLTSGLVLNPTVGRELVPLWPWPYTARKA
jgi:hypothetical protein